MAKETISFAKAKLAATKRLPLRTERQIEKNVEAWRLSPADAFIQGAEEAQAEFILRINALRPTSQFDAILDKDRRRGYRPMVTIPAFNEAAEIKAEDWNRLGQRQHEIERWISKSAQQGADIISLKLRIEELEAALRELYDDSPYLAEGSLSERIDRLLGYATDGEGKS